MAKRHWSPAPGGQPGHRVALALGELGASVVLSHRGTSQPAAEAALRQLTGLGADGTGLAGGLPPGSKAASLSGQAQARPGRRASWCTPRAG
jgi:hypothetical protein